MLGSGLLYLLILHSSGGLDTLVYLIQVILVLLLAFRILMDFFYSLRPNLLLYRDRLLFRMFCLKGETPLSNIAYLVTGYSLFSERVPDSQVRFINDPLFKENKILIILNSPVIFKTLLGRDKIVKELVIDVVDVGMFVWSMIARNPQIEVFHMPDNAMVFRKGVFTYEPVRSRRA